MAASSSVAAAAGSAERPSVEEARARATARAATAAAALAVLRRAPCWLPDLARELGRSPREASDVAWAMCGLGLAVRAGPTVYAPAGYAGPALRHCPASGGIAPDPLAPRPAPDAAAGAAAVRERLAAFLAVPRALWEVGGHLRLSVRRASRLLAMAVGLGLVAQPRRGIYVRADRLDTLRGPVAAAGGPRPRRGGGGGDRGGLVRDRILAFLSEPRSAGDVARHIGRTVPIATGHLAAMRRRSLVRRIGYAAYALEAYDGPPLRWDARVGLLVPWTPAPAGGAAGVEAFATAFGRLPRDDSAEDRCDARP